MVAYVKKKLFAVIQFSELPSIRDIEDYECVPQIWLIHSKSNKKVSVAIPEDENIIEIRERAKSNDNISECPDLRFYGAVIKYESDSYINAMNWIAKKKGREPIEEEESNTINAGPGPVLDRKLRSAHQRSSRSSSEIDKPPQTVKREKIVRKPLPRMKITRPLNFKNFDKIQSKSNSPKTNFSCVSDNIELNDAKIAKKLSINKQSTIILNDQLIQSTATEKTVASPNNEKAKESTQQKITENKSSTNPDLLNKYQSNSSELVDEQNLAFCQYRNELPSMPILDVHNSIEVNSIGENVISDKGNKSYPNKTPSNACEPEPGFKIPIFTDLLYNQFQELFLQEAIGKQSRTGISNSQETFSRNAETNVSKTVPKPNNSFNESSQLHQDTPPDLVAKNPKPSNTHSNAEVKKIAYEIFNSVTRDQGPLFHDMTNNMPSTSYNKPLVKNSPKVTHHGGGPLTHDVTIKTSSTFQRHSTPEKSTKVVQNIQIPRDDANSNKIISTFHHVPLTDRSTKVIKDNQDQDEKSRILDVTNNKPLTSQRNPIPKKYIKIIEDDQGSRVSITKTNIPSTSHHTLSNEAFTNAIQDGLKPYLDNNNMKINNDILPTSQQKPAPERSEVIQNKKPQPIHHILSNKGSLIAVQDKTTPKKSIEMIENAQEPRVYTMKNNIPSSFHDIPSNKGSKKGIPDGQELRFHDMMCNMSSASQRELAPENSIKLNQNDKRQRLRSLMNKLSHTSHHKQSNEDSSKTIQDRQKLHAHYEKTNMPFQCKPISERSTSVIQDKQQPRAYDATNNMPSTSHHIPTSAQHSNELYENLQKIPSLTVQRNPRNKEVSHITNYDHKSMALKNSSQSTSRFDLLPPPTIKKLSSVHQYNQQEILHDPVLYARNYSENNSTVPRFCTQGDVSDFRKKYHGSNLLHQRPNKTSTDHRSLQQNIFSSQSASNPVAERIIMDQSAAQNLLNLAYRSQYLPRQDDIWQQRYLAEDTVSKYEKAQGFSQDVRWKRHGAIQNQSNGVIQPSLFLPQLQNSALPNCIYSLQERVVERKRQNEIVYNNHNIHQQNKKMSEPSAEQNELNVSGLENIFLEPPQKRQKVQSHQDLRQNQDMSRTHIKHSTEANEMDQILKMQRITKSTPLHLPEVPISNKKPSLNAKENNSKNDLHTKMTQNEKLIEQNVDPEINHACIDRNSGVDSITFENNTQDKPTTTNDFTTKVNHQKYLSKIAEQKILDGMADYFHIMSNIRSKTREMYNNLNSSLESSLKTYHKLLEIKTYTR